MLGLVEGVFLVFATTGVGPVLGIEEPFDLCPFAKPAGTRSVDAEVSRGRTHGQTPTSRISVRIVILDCPLPPLLASLRGPLLWITLPHMGR